MPTTYAHLRLGEAVRKQLPNTIQKVIDEHEDLFAIGVHGPDPLFYYNPILPNKIGKLGSQIHEEAARTFFTKAVQVIHKNTNKGAHLAFVYGYLCHFALDYVCHGYVAQQMEDTGLSHYEIEAEYDRRLLCMDGYKNPVAVCVTSHLHPTVFNAAVIADFYEMMTGKQVYKSLKGMVFYLELLRAPTKGKRKFVFGAMRAVGMYQKMHGLVMNYEENPECASTTDEMVRRFPEAVSLAVKLIAEFEVYQKRGGKLSEVFSYNFESQKE